MVNFTKTADELETIEDKWLYLLKHARSSDKLPKFNDYVLDDAVARITVDPGKDKELLEAQVACTMSIDEQRVNLIKKNLQKGTTPKDVTDFLDIPLSQVLEIQRDL